MKKFKYLFFFLIIICGWLCGKGGNKNLISNQPINQISPNQKQKSILNQAREHFQFVFDELRQLVIHLDIKSIFNTVHQSFKSSWSGFNREIYSRNLFNNKIKHACIYYRIGNRKSQKEVKKWIIIDKNYQKLINHFNVIIQDSSGFYTEVYESYSEYYIYLILFLNLDKVNQKMITQYLSQYLERPKISLKTKLKLLKATENHSEAYNIVRAHFFNNFDFYCSLIEKKIKKTESNNFSLSISSNDSIPPIDVIEKLSLAVNLKKIDSERWGKINLESKIFQELEIFLLEPLPAELLPPNDPLKYDRDYQCGSSSMHFLDRFIAICLWQELNDDKISDYIENWFKNCIGNLENLISTLEVSEGNEYLIFLIGLYFHERICKKARQWAKDFKNYVQNKKTLDKNLIIEIFESIIFHSDLLNFNT